MLQDLLITVLLHWRVILLKYSLIIITNITIIIIIITIIIIIIIVVIIIIIIIIIIISFENQSLLKWNCKNVTERSLFSPTANISPCPCFLKNFSFFVLLKQLMTRNSRSNVVWEEESRKTSGIQSMSSFVC